FKNRELEEYKEHVRRISVDRHTTANSGEQVPKVRDLNSFVPPKTQVRVPSNRAQYRKYNYDVAAREATTSATSSIIVNTNTTAVPTNTTAATTNTTAATTSSTIVPTTTAPVPTDAGQSQEPPPDHNTISADPVDQSEQPSACAGAGAGDPPSDHESSSSSSSSEESSTSTSSSDDSKKRRRRKRKAKRKKEDKTLHRRIKKEKKEEDRAVTPDNLRSTTSRRKKAQVLSERYSIPSNRENPLFPRYNSI
ncbi:MAG: hypothetical protein GY738_27485, partial [Pseudoalteromonas sp.]|nr:hypothetical protein [Pseudoalteromonas sp.]